MALSEKTKHERLKVRLEAYTKENCLLAIEFLNRYKEPVTDEGLLNLLK